MPPPPHTCRDYSNCNVACPKIRWFHLVSKFLFVFVWQNGSTARDIAAQQGYRAVAELLGEYERRLASDSNTTTRPTTSEGTDDAGSSDSSSAASGAKAGRLVRRPPAVYNRDVIPSPKNSPLKTCTPLDQYIRSNKPSHWCHLSFCLWCIVRLDLAISERLEVVLHQSITF